jgi:hypothetical protein
MGLRARVWIELRTVFSVPPGSRAVPAGFQHPIRVKRVVIAELPQASTAAQRTAARQRLEVVAAPCADIFRKYLVSNAVVAYVPIIDLACRNIVPGAIRAIGDLPLKIDLHRLPRACTAGNLL